jgi:hypothetical protein
VKGPVVTAALTAAVAPTHAEAAAMQTEKGRKGFKTKETSRANVAYDGKERSKAASGNASNYLSARIARDAPAIHERMKAGEFPSVRAAAKAAKNGNSAVAVSQALTPTPEGDWQQHCCQFRSATRKRVTPLLPVLALRPGERAHDLVDLGIIVRAVVPVIDHNKHGATGRET